MNGSRADAARLLDGIEAGVGDDDVAEVVICPPFILIPQVAARLAGSAIACGGQNLDIHESGAFTGEISGPMLRDFDCRYCIVGHSERRALYAETNATVAAKFAAAQNSGLTPILCVGESLQERERGDTESVIAAQLDAVIEHTGVSALASAVVAYEPVWAIGTGRTASPEQAQAVHRFLRERIGEHDRAVAGDIRILYGGSVKADNAASLFTQHDVDGGLIGGASLKAQDFVAIVKAAASCSGQTHD